MDAFEFRHATPEDWDSLVALATATFSQGRSVETVRAYFHRLMLEPGFNWQNFRIATHKGTLVANVAVARRTLRVGSAEFAVGGVANVMTHPDFRGNHLATRLLRDALLAMKEMECDITLLDGIPDFYHRLGYATIWPGRQCRVRVKDILRGEAVDAGYHMRPYAESDAPELLELYTREWGSRRVGAVRSLDWLRWRLAFQPPTGVPETYVVTDSIGRIQGYSAGWDFSDRFEIIVTNPTAMAAILRHHASHVTDPEAEIVWRDLPDTASGRAARQLFTAHYDVIYEHQGGWMGRLLDPDAALEVLQGELAIRFAAMGLPGAEKLSLTYADGSVVLSLPGSQVTIPEAMFLPLVLGHFASGEIETLFSARMDAAGLELLKCAFPPEANGLAGLDWF